MAYQRKTRTVYTIQQLTEQGWEDVTEELTRSEGLARLKEYRADQPQYSARMVRRREKINP